MINSIRLYEDITAMENSLLIALMAIAVSLFALGLSIVVQTSLQSDIRNLNNNLIEQSQTIKSLGIQSNESIQLINQQNAQINNLKILQNASQTQINTLQTNVINLKILQNASQTQINTLQTNVINLENRVATLEQRLSQPSPTPGSTYFPNAVGFDVAGGQSANQERVYKKLPETLPSDKWIADFDYRFISSVTPTFFVFCLTGTSDDPELQPRTDTILIEHGVWVDQLFVKTHSGSSSAIAIKPNVQYYVRLERTPTNLELSIFSDPARTIQIQGSPVDVAINATDYNNDLKFIQHDGSITTGSARTLTAELTNTKIYVKEPDGSESTLFQDDYHSGKGWTQIGTEIVVNGPATPQQQAPLSSPNMK